MPKQDRVEVAQDVHGIIGVIELCFCKFLFAINFIHAQLPSLSILKAKYLLVITGKEFVASIQGHKVWKITRGVALPIGKMENSMMQPSNSEEEKLAKVSWVMGPLW